ncbi:hypothetical protein [Pseudomonas tohonis]|uniref:phage tail tube protein n=1 Tax=Pseudomonas tohonis TaxID=2725477 RepID=UPI0022F0873B|nr:hypothetical protein [Pseudomonas tohonis]
MLNTQLFRGPCFVAPYPSWNLQELFKLQNMTAEPTTTEITIPDPTRIGLPTLDSVTATSQIVLSGEAVSFSAEAAAIVLYGSVESVPSGTVTDEAHDARIDRVIKLDKLTLDVTEVTDSAGTTTYARNIDYSVVPGGVRILPGGELAADIAAVSGTDKKLPILISYTHPTVDLIKPFVEGQKFYRLMVGQKNEGGDGNIRRIQCFYAKIALNGGIPLNQGAEFGTVPIQITLLADPAIFDADEAAMWQWEVERKA